MAKPSLFGIEIKGEDGEAPAEATNAPLRSASRALVRALGLDPGEVDLGAVSKALEQAHAACSDYDDEPEVEVEEG
jgi:hypothetical protein